MPSTDIPGPFKLGEWVLLRGSNFGPVRIIEYRGELGPKGARVYRLRVGKKHGALITEVLEEQLEALPPK